LRMPIGIRQSAVAASPAKVKQQLSCNLILREAPTSGYLAIGSRSLQCRW
jgi:hypothetical protein